MPETPTSQLTSPPHTHTFHHPPNDPPSNPYATHQVWKHHNLRLAYVAQHSFHHVEQHLEESPVDYFKWR